MSTWCLFFTKEGNKVDKEEGEKQKGLVTVLTAICKDSQYPFATVVPSKGGSEYAVKSLVTWLKELKWDKLTIHVDQETALNKVYEKVQAELKDMVTEEVFKIQLTIPSRWGDDQWTAGRQNPDLVGRLV